MKQPPIFISISSNEAMRPRIESIKKAIANDERFAWAPMGGYQEPPFDLEFSTIENFQASDGPRNRTIWMHVELKDFTGDHHSDYLGSILDGHLWEQTQTAKELGQPFAVVVLGDDNDVAQAIAKAVFSRGFRGKEAADKIFEYSAMVEGFEANCIGEHIQVWRLKDNPYKRMLLRVRKILQGGDLTGFAPAPADGERRAVGLSILAGKGIGTTKAAAILEKFRIRLEPKGDHYLTDCAGIGEKLAKSIWSNGWIVIDSRNIIRPPKPKKARNSPKDRCETPEVQSPEKEGDRRTTGKRAGKAKAARIAEVLG